jgi:hypothetical protein
LGLSPEAFWCLTAAEFWALKEVQEAPVKRWAMQQAAFHNAHNLGEASMAPWIAGDFLGTGNREARIHRARVDAAALIQEKLRLRQMRAGERYADIPEWAFGRAGRPNG